MLHVCFLPVNLEGFYGWSIFVRSWIYFFGSHFGFREGEDASLNPSVCRISVIDYAVVSEQYVVELSGLPYFRWNLVQPCSFPIFNFSENRVEIFLSEQS